ncbi:hypothetical protein ABY58_09680 [Edwardsiella ictaluri]|nr:hypothetical protein ABY58_09680 [Edwardsiella ictaluri]
MTVCILGSGQQDIPSRIQHPLLSANLYTLTGDIAAGVNGDLLTGIDGGALRTGTVVSAVLRGGAQGDRDPAFDDGAVRQCALCRRGACPASLRAVRYALSPLSIRRAAASAALAVSTAQPPALAVTPYCELRL